MAALADMARVMRRGTLICVGSVGVMVGLSAAQWRITTPGVITFTEWRVALLAAGPCMVFVLCSYWIGDGRPPGDWR